MEDKDTFQQMEKRMAALEKQVEQYRNAAIKYQTLFESFPHGITVSDKNGNIIQTNPVAEHLLGISRQEHEKRSIDGQEWRLIRPDGSDMPPEEYASVIALKENRIVSDLEMGISKPEGQVTWINVTAAPLPLEGHGVVITYNDITAKRESEKKLRESQAELQRTLDATTDGIWTWRFKTNALFFSSRYYTMLGYAPDEFPATFDNWTALLHPDDREKALAAAERYLKTKPDVYENEFRLKARDGGYRWIRTRARVVERDASGEAVSMIGNHEDITAYKLAEKSLKESRAKYRALVDQAPAALFLHDKEGRIVDVNRSALNTYGYARETLLKMNVVDIDPNYRKIANGDMFRQTLQQRGGIEFETRHRRKDGSTFPVRINLTSIFLKDEAYYFALATDLTEHRRTEQKLRRSEAVFRTLFEQAAVGVAQVAPDGAFLKVNDRFCEIIGYDRQEIHGLTFQDITHPEDLALDEKHIVQVLAGKTDTFEIEKRYLHKNGRVVWIRLYSNAVRKPDGSINYAIAVITDITGRRLAEEALRQSEEKYRLLVENQTDLVIKMDLEGRFLFVSPSYCEMFGKTEQELLGRKSKTLIHPDDRKPTAEAMQGLYKPPFAVYLEQRALTKHGWRWLAWATSAVKDADGRVVAMIAVGRDIHKRKLMENQLWESKERFEKVFESQPDAIFVLNTERPARIVECNPAASTIFGYAAHEMVGHPVEKLHVDASHLRDFQNMLLRTVEKGNFLNAVRFSMQRKDGTIFPTEHTVLELKGDGGQRTGWISIIRDLTEKQKIEDRLQQAQKMESIGSLAGGIAHDFNNILFPIVGLTEMMLEDLPADSPERENIEEIFKAGRRGRDLVKQILAFSRQSEHRKLPVRPQQIFKEVMKLSRATIPADIEIRPDIQQGCGLVMADPTQLHQIAMNMITNAYHAIAPDSGTITVQLKETQITPDDPESLSLKPGPYARLAVSDTGRGIEPAIMEKIFEPYFTTKSKDKGTGLGLAVVYGIVKAHKGDIRVSSQPGLGTTFFVYLPIIEKSDESIQIEQPEPTQTGSERILLVDDEEAIVRLETQMLERLGYNITSCAGSLEALKTFKADPTRYDLILTDMAMPHMTGAQFAEAVLAIRNDIPIIICTGFSERLDAIKDQSPGIKGVLMKPVVRSELVKMVRNVLDETKGAASEF